jgi:hypothetical protein
MDAGPIDRSLLLACRSIELHGCCRCPTGPTRNIAVVRVNNTPHDAISPLIDRSKQPAGRVTN